MKKQMIIAAVSILLAAISFSSCKKDNKDNPASTSQIKNTNWTGEFNYASKGPEPVSIEFMDFGQLTWRELLADHTGSWSVTGNKLTIALDGATSFTADISGNSLTNIQSTDTGGRSLKSAALNKDAIPDLNGKVSYTRTGRAVHFTLAPEYVWFTVITSATIMKGTNHAPSDPTVYGFLVTKQ